jgi:cellulose biosynthesis protein BcsQ
VRLQTLEHSENLQRLRERFGELVWEPIPESIIWAEATAFHVPVFVHAPDHSATEYVWKMIERVERLGGHLDEQPQAT